MTYRKPIKAKILEAAPVAGTVEEVLFEAKASDHIWVEFTLDAASWVGIFGKGRSVPLSNSVAIVGMTACAFVVAGGIGYMIETRDCTCNFKSECD